MNHSQRKLTAGMSVGLLLLLLFPAWVEQPAGSFQAIEQERGRAFLLSPPQPTMDEVGRRGKVGIDTSTMIFNSGSLLGAWIALFFALKGADLSFSDLVRKRRFTIALALGAFAPVPPFMQPSTYVANIAFLAMAFGDTGHIPSIALILIGVALCLAYSALIYGILWVTSRKDHATA